MSKTYFLPEPIDWDWSAIATQKPAPTADEFWQNIKEFQKLVASRKRKELTMPTHPDALAFLKSIEEQPEDDAPKLIYADWLEERGDPECAAWRWLVAFHRLPSRKRNDPYGLLHWAPNDGMGHQVEEASLLPTQIYERLPTQIAVNHGYEGGKLKAVAMALIAAAQAFVLAVKDGHDFDHWTKNFTYEEGLIEQELIEGDTVIRSID